MRPRHLLAASLLALIFSGCATTPQPGPAVTVPVEAPALLAPIKGSEASSTLLDNFTAFISAVDGQPVAAGREGWNTPIELKPGHHVLGVGFKRGVFTAQAKLELLADARTNYQLKYATDAQLFGHNSFCDFWIVNLGTDQPVTGIKKATVTKGG